MTVKPELPTYTSDNIGNNALPTRNSIYFEPGTKYLCSMIVMYNYLIPQPHPMYIYIGAHQG